MVHLQDTLLYGDFCYLQKVCLYTACLPNRSLLWPGFTTFVHLDGCLFKTITLTAFSARLFCRQP